MSVDCIENPVASRSLEGNRNGKRNHPGDISASDDSPRTPYMKCSSPGHDQSGGGDSAGGAESAIDSEKAGEGPMTGSASQACESHRCSSTGAGGEAEGGQESSPDANADPASTTDAGQILELPALDYQHGSTQTGDLSRGTYVSPNDPLRRVWYHMPNFGPKFCDAVRKYSIVVGLREVNAITRKAGKEAPCLWLGILGNPINYTTGSKRALIEAMIRRGQIGPSQSDLDRPLALSANGYVNASGFAIGGDRANMLPGLLDGCDSPGMSSGGFSGMGFRRRHHNGPGGTGHKTKSGRSARHGSGIDGSGRRGGDQSGGMGLGGMGHGNASPSGRASDPLLKKKRGRGQAGAGRDDGMGLGSGGVSRRRRADGGAGASGPGARHTGAGQGASGMEGWNGSSIGSGSMMGSGSMLDADGFQLTIDVDLSESGLLAGCDTQTNLALSRQMRQMGNSIDRQSFQGESELTSLAASPQPTPGTRAAGSGLEGSILTGGPGTGYGVAYSAPGGPAYNTRSSSMGSDSYSSRARHGVMPESRGGMGGLVAALQKYGNTGNTHSSTGLSMTGLGMSGLSMTGLGMTDVHGRGQRLTLSGEASASSLACLASPTGEHSIGILGDLVRNADSSVSDSVLRLVSLSPVKKASSSSSSIGSNIGSSNFSAVSSLLMDQPQSASSSHTVLATQGVSSFQNLPTSHSMSSQGISSSQSMSTSQGSSSQGLVDWLLQQEAQAKAADRLVRRSAMQLSLKLSSASALVDHSGLSSFDNNVSRENSHTASNIQSASSTGIVNSPSKHMREQYPPLGPQDFVPSPKLGKLPTVGDVPLVGGAPDDRAMAT